MHETNENFCRRLRAGQFLKGTFAKIADPMVIEMLAAYELDFVVIDAEHSPIGRREINTLLEEDIRMLCEWKRCDIQEMSVEEDHIHLVVSVPPKVSISELMGTLKGKLAIKLFKSYSKMKHKPYWGNHFWARGY